MDDTGGVSASAAASSVWKQENLPVRSLLSTKIIIIDALKCSGICRVTIIESLRIHNLLCLFIHFVIVNDFIDRKSKTKKKT